MGISPNQLRTAMTNSLNVSFPTAMSGGPISAATAFSELLPFGDVARVEVPPGLNSTTVVVSFYDSRSAATAAAALGDDRASPAPQFGECSVDVPGAVQFEESMIPEIAEIRQEGNGDRYKVTFFDTRTAERAKAYIASLDTKACVTAPPPGLFFSRPESDSAVALAEVPKARHLTNNLGALLPNGPRYCNDLRLSEVNWTDLANGRDKRTTLRLRCVPNKLCVTSAFEQLLKSAKLLELTTCFRVFPGRRLGTALVDCVDAPGVIAIGKYFHGRQWAKCLPISVSFAAIQGEAEVNKAYPEYPQKVSTKRCSLADGRTGMKVLPLALSGEPWRIETEEKQFSEVSTEVDESELTTSENRSMPRQISSGSNSSNQVDAGQQPAKPLALLAFPPGLSIQG